MCPYSCSVGVISKEHSIATPGSRGKKPESTVGSKLKKLQGPESKYRAKFPKCQVDFMVIPFIVRKFLEKPRRPKFIKSPLIQSKTIS